MKLLTRPDGVSLAWKVRGEGPSIVLAKQFFGVAEHRPAARDLDATAAS